jgi:hypothetical protein
VTISFSIIPLNGISLHFETWRKSGRANSERHYILREKTILDFEGSLAVPAHPSGKGTLGEVKALGNEEHSQ